MVKHRVYVSCDYDFDRNCQLLMNEWNDNPEFEFRFGAAADGVAQRPVPHVQTILGKCIRDANYTLVIVGRGANRKHRDAAEIGYLNWQHFEIAKSREHRKRLVGVKLEASNAAPGGLLEDDTVWALSFDREPVLLALRAA